MLTPTELPPALAGIPPLGNLPNIGNAPMATKPTSSKPSQAQANSNSSSNANSETKMNNSDTNTNDTNNASNEPSANPAAWVSKALDRAVKVLVHAGPKDKKTKVVNGTKVALRNLDMPGRTYSVPTAASIVAAVNAELAFDADKRPITDKLVSLCDDALARFASLGETTGTDTVYASMDDAAKAVTLTYKVASPPSDWAAWLTVEPSETTRLSDTAIRAAQDIMLDAWLSGMYYADDNGTPCDATGAALPEGAAKVYPPQAQALRLANAAMLEKVGKGKVPVAALADLLANPRWNGMKPGQDARMAAWVKDAGLSFPTADDVDETPSKATLAALAIFSQAQALYDMGQQETPAVELDF